MKLSYRIVSASGAAVVRHWVLQWKNRASVLVVKQREPVWTADADKATGKAAIRDDDDEKQPK
jgi:hypothetical protein